MESLVTFCIVLLMCCSQAYSRPRASCGGKAADVVFVLDSSSSIWEPDFRKQLKFVHDVIQKFNVGAAADESRVGIVTFGHTSWLQFHLNQYDELTYLQEAIKNIQYQPGYLTNTALALRYMTETMFTEDNGSRRNVPKIAIVITDGQSQDAIATRMAAKEARGMGITIFAIGVGYGVDDTELRDIASNPHKKYVFTVNNFQALDSLKDLLAIETCEVAASSTVNPSTTTTTKPTTTVMPTPTHVPVPDAIMQGDSSVQVTNCGNKPADIYFVIDSSSSIYMDEYRTQLKFVQDVVDLFDVADDKTRIGVITFSDRPHPKIYLDSYTRKTALIEGIRSIPYMGGGTNTAAAIKYIRKRAFTPDVARKNVAHIAIVLTDGLSRDTEATATEAALAQKDGIHIFAIGIGSADISELKQIASEPAEDFAFHVDTFEALNSIKNNLAVKTCDIGEDAILQDTQTCGQHAMTDMMFVYDSASMGSKKFNLVSEFVSDVVKGIHVSPGTVRVGRLTDNCAGENDILLSSSDVLNFNDIEFPAISDLLQRLKMDAFSEVNGGRFLADQIAILFVDEDMQEGLKAAVTSVGRIPDIEVFVVAIGNIDPALIGHFASRPSNEHVISIPSYEALANTKSLILDRVCESLRGLVEEITY